MYRHVQPFTVKPETSHFEQEYATYREILFNLIDTPIKTTQHIGGTKHFNYPTEPILDILVGVDNLHDITSLDEKRLNYAGFYRIHQPMLKKVLMAKFNDLIELKQTVRLHIIQRNTDIFHQYVEIDELLSNDTIAIQDFTHFKQSIKNLSIREYETRKANYFKKLLPLIQPK
ncbi:GrpB family protein [Staphylococcus chromogenes]|uniref:GrpB family protein n=1 Tax=Staphylococcus chromogenes TaxID=46126 RepID=UPI002888438E|nr:GrpB family protein [Staphylococcus chromogenes]MDT0740013.1 GrpB family protein [Staphylococcus chromogenes]